VADGGFVEELEPLIEKVGSDNIVIVQLTREGHDYSTDSRRYFNGNIIKEVTINYATKIDKAYVLKEELDIKTYRVHNNGSVRNFQSTLIDIYNELNEDYKLDSINRQTEESAEAEHSQSEDVS
jgi:N-glycosylase/DNA lyase